MENIKTTDPAEHLASVFKGGRISGWVRRNNSALQSGEGEKIEVESLLELSPGFAEKTKDLSTNQRLNLVQQALALANESPLSATKLQLR